MYRFLRWYSDQKTPVKVVFIICFFFFLVLLFFGIAACVGSFVYSIESIVSTEEHSIWYYGLVSPKGKPVTFVAYAILLIITIVSFTVTYRNHVKTSDERGVHFMEDNTYGSARWLDESEIEKSFAVSNIKDTTTTIYGQVTQDGEEVVGWKPNDVGGTGNRNVIVLASMGSGKSFTYVRTELIQSILRGNSFVVTDPSAELFSDLGMFLKQRGVSVKVLNLAEPQYSEFWDCLSETIDPETERLDSTRLNDFADIYMQNSSTKDGKEDFWYGSALNLLKAVVGYTAYKHEEPIIQAYVRLYKEILNMSEADSDETTQTMQNEYVSFPWCREAIRMAAAERNVDQDELENIFESIKKYAADKPFTIGQVFENLLNFNNATEEMEQISVWHPAKTAYLTYQTNDTDAIRKSALQGIQLRFQLFQDNKLKEVLSHDGIHLSEINKKQSAYFVIMSDKSMATKPIASLFFSFLIKDAQDVYDREAQISKEKGIENPCLPVVAMLDEFFSIGIIGGSPESFGTTMSNSRKRHIYISIIVQVYSQIEALYGEQIRDVIQGGCSTLLYLGGNDPSTCEFISEFASGEATVLAEMHKQLTGVLNTGVPTDLTVRSEKRFLLTVDEARRWKDQVLVVKQGEYPLRLNPFPWIEHPLYKNGYIQPTSIYSNIKKLQERLADLKKEAAKIPDPQTHLYEMIKNMKKRYVVDKETGEIIESKPKAVEITADDVWEDDDDSTGTTNTSTPNLFDDGVNIFSDEPEINEEKPSQNEENNSSDSSKEDAKSPKKTEKSDTETKKASSQTKGGRRGASAKREKSDSPLNN